MTHLDERLDDQFNEQIRHEIGEVLKTAPMPPTVERIKADVGSVAHSVAIPEPSRVRGLWVREPRILAVAAAVLLAVVAVSILQGQGPTVTDTSLDPAQSTSVTTTDADEPVLSNEEKMAEAERAQLLAIGSFAPYVESVVWPHFGIDGVHEAGWVLAAVEEVRPGGIAEWGEQGLSEVSPAIVRSWYRADGRTVAQLEVMAPTTDSGDVRLLQDDPGLVQDGMESWVIDVDGVDVRRSDAGPWSMASWYSEQGELINLHVHLPSNVEDHIASVQRLNSEQWRVQTLELSDRISQQPIVWQSDSGAVTMTARQGDAGAQSDFFPLRDVCLSHVGQVDEGQVEGQQKQACVGNRSLRSSGPYVRTPQGMLSYPMILVGMTTFSVVVDDVWWVGLYVEPVEGSEISIDGIRAVSQDGESGQWEPLETVLFDDVGVWLLAPVPPSSAVVRFETVPGRPGGSNLGLDGDGSYLIRWRPSS